MPSRFWGMSNLPVFESGDDVFDGCSDKAASPVAVVAGDSAGAIWPGCGDGGDCAVATVAEDVVLAGEEVGCGGAGDDDVIAVAGPAVAGDDYAAPV